MNISDAKQIIAEVNPDVLVDESHPDAPALLCLYRDGDKGRTNLHLPALTNESLRNFLKSF